jgi:hypothetical protein
MDPIEPVASDGTPVARAGPDEEGEVYILER